VSQQNIYIAKCIKVLNMVQNAKRSRDDVLEPVTIRDDSKTTPEPVEDMEERESKRIKMGDDSDQDSLC
jgi:hypothetical protein